MTDTRLENKLGFDKIRTGISDRCSTEYAVRRVMEETFSSDPGVIRSRLELTDEMRLVMMFEDSFPTAGYIDALPFLEPLLKEGYSLDTLSLGKLKTLLDTTRKVINFFSSIKDGVYPNLKKMSSAVANYPEIGRRIENILDKYGSIKDSASDELFAIRRSLRDKEGAISKKAGIILKKAQEEGLADSDAGVVVREGKFLIPVSTSGKRKIQGFVVGESATGKTTFVEPTEIIELENEISELRFAETREITRILFAFSEFVRPYVPDLMKNATFVGEIDFLMAKARTALDMVAGMPVISEDGTFNLRKARHPLLESALRRDGRSIVPLSVNLSPQKHLLLISGPNAGGKSVCLKTVGLLQYMFQWGALIPTSESSELPVFDRIFVSIGDDQSLENDLSTYSSFLADMREMLTFSNEKTLVLIDEFGSGTEPAAGGAIAEAILADIDRKGVYGVITTHYTNLKLYAAQDGSGVLNGAMMFDAARMEPLFQLQTGLPGNSFAFEMARKMRLPEHIVKDAEERAGDGFVGMEKNLRKIARNRRALDEKLQKIKKTDKTLEGLTEQYLQELEDIKSQKKAILEEAKKQAEDIVKGAGKEVEKTIRVIKESQADKEKTKEARRELQSFVEALQKKKNRDQKIRDEYIDRKINQLEKRNGKKKASASEERSLAPLAVGEKVRIIDNGFVGEVAKVSSKSLTIIVGNISSTTTPDKVERISSNEFREASRKTFEPVYEKMDSSIRERKLNFKPELDIRGERLSDALDIVTHYIDDAIMLGIGTVRIIHGKGTGVLRDEIQKYLKTVPGINATDEDIRHGGTGVTVVTFE